MSATTSAALAHRKFIYFGCSLPYTEEIGGRTILVTRARPKLEVGAARRVMLAHFLDEVAAVSVDGLAITRISEDVAVDEPIEHLVIDASTLPKP